jgi:hypothetical protein
MYACVEKKQRHATSTHGLGAALLAKSFASSLSSLVTSFSSSLRRFGSMEMTRFLYSAVVMFRQRGLSRIHRILSRGKFFRYSNSFQSLTCRFAFHDGHGMCENTLKQSTGQEFKNQFLEPNFCGS